MRIRLIIKHTLSLPEGSKDSDMFETYDMEVDEVLEKKLFKKYSYCGTSIIGFEKLEEGETHGHNR